MVEEQTETPNLLPFCVAVLTLPGIRIEERLASSGAPLRNPSDWGSGFQQYVTRLSDEYHLLLFDEILGPNLDINSDYAQKAY
ncbi:hypothetical protein QVD17_14278 [Tagetes erecta]|uniref:Uncharacterized protein n=1 Tax=Tagetes erecta TaxID=13708 RepID=A0AAD8KYT4_TARER|nr:hypothetical protein QVD17_14278 [Tagetes erecta]